MIAVRKVSVERMCDLQGPGMVSGERADGMPLILLMVPMPDREENPAASLYRGLWYDAHYWGVPDREKERSLARWRRAIHERRK